MQSHPGVAISIGHHFENQVRRSYDIWIDKFTLYSNIVGSSGLLDTHICEEKSPIKLRMPISNRSAPMQVKCSYLTQSQICAFCALHWTQHPRIAIIQNRGVRSRSLTGYIPYVRLIVIPIPTILQAMAFIHGHRTSWHSCPMNDTLANLRWDLIPGYAG